MYIRVLVVLLSVSFSLWAEPKKQIDLPMLTSLTYYAEDYPPSVFYEGEVLRGISVRMLRAIWQELGMKAQPIEVVPWARGYKEIISKPKTVLFAMSKTAQRADKFKWVGPIYSVDYILIAKKGKILKAKWLSELHSHSVAVIRHDVTEQIVLDAHFAEQQIVETNNMYQALAIFKADRVELMAISRSGLGKAINENMLQVDDFEEVFLLDTVEDYFAFSKDVPDVVINAFQRAFDKHKRLNLALIDEFKL